MAYSVQASFVLISFASFVGLAKGGEELTIRVEVPTAGWYLSQDGVHSIIGIPGALQSGPQVRLPDSLLRLRMAPGRNFGVGEQAGTLVVALARSETIQVDGSILTGWTGGSVAFSPSGAAAVNVSSDGRRVQLVGGLPHSPRVLREFDAPDAVTLAATNNDASTVLLASGGMVYVCGEQAACTGVFTAPKPSALLFADGGSKAVIADTSRGVWLIEGLTGVPHARALDLELAHPSSLEAMGGGSVLLVAGDAGAGVAIDLATGAKSPIDFGMPVAALHRLNHRALLVEPSSPGSNAMMMEWSPQGDQALTPSLTTLKAGSR